MSTLPDIPKKLKIAADEGKLVLFVGAGVSRGAPVNMPSFKELTEHILAKEIDDKKSSCEKELLKAKNENKTDIHGRCRKYFNEHERKNLKKFNENGENILFNENHKKILEIALASEFPKIVTTNFDACFDHAENFLKKNFLNKDKELIRYFAPALPLADKFSGIVYLHGKANISHSEIIIAEEDFSKAYINRGWVRRFLIDLFDNNIVVFIGYSHNDVLMKYFAKGLEIDKKNERYIIIEKQEEEELEKELENQKLTLLRYELDKNNKNKYINLDKRLNKLSNIIAGDISFIEDLAKMIPRTKEDKSLIEEHIITNKDNFYQFIKLIDKQDEEKWFKFFEGIIDISNNKEILDIYIRWIAENISKNKIIDYDEFLNKIGISDLSLKLSKHIIECLCHDENCLPKLVEKWVRFMISNHPSKINDCCILNLLLKNTGEKISDAIIFDLARIFINFNYSVKASNSLFDYSLLDRFYKELVENSIQSDPILYWKGLIIFEINNFFSKDKPHKQNKIFEMIIYNCIDALSKYKELFIKEIEELYKENKQSFFVKLICNYINKNFSEEAKVLIEKYPDLEKIKTDPLYRSREPNLGFSKEEIEEIYISEFLYKQIKSCKNKEFEPYFERIESSIKIFNENILIESNIDYNHLFEKAYNNEIYYTIESLFLLIERRFEIDKLRVLKESEKELIRMMLKNKRDLNANATVAVIVGYHLRDIFYYDSEFCRKEILPILKIDPQKVDYPQEVRRALWYGFLEDHLSPVEFKDDLLEAFTDKTINDDEIVSKKDVLFSMLADIVLNSHKIKYPFDKEEPEWFKNTKKEPFILPWLKAVSNILLKIDRNKLEEHWKDWLENYTDHLLDNVFFECTEEYYEVIFDLILRSEFLQTKMAQKIIECKNFKLKKEKTYLNYLDHMSPSLHDRESSDLGYKETEFTASIIAFILNKITEHYLYYDRLWNFISSLKEQFITNVDRKSFKKHFRKSENDIDLLIKKISKTNEE